jgi:hypothetical protein
MRLEKHVGNAMSSDLLFALAVVSFDHLVTSTYSSDICVHLGSESASGPTSFAGDLFSITINHCLFCLIQPESKASRTSRACRLYPIPDDMGVCFDELSLSLSTYIELGRCC